MNAVPLPLQHLAFRIGNATGLAPDAMANEVKSALRDATTSAGWLPPERRRAGAGGEPPVETGSVRHAVGKSTFDPSGAGIHRIGNYSGVLAISLHAYGVGGDHIATGVNRICA